MSDIIESPNFSVFAQWLKSNIKALHAQPSCADDIVLGAQLFRRGVAAHFALCKDAQLGGEAILVRPLV